AQTTWLPGKRMVTRKKPTMASCLEYWEASVRRPHKVLFLRYEEMLLDPKSNLKKLAKFIGCEFSQEEDEKRVADSIGELCMQPGQA
ncbi:hypothetical protein EJB05_43916, partial [Eragrostis curvula]